ncbi:MAG: hypothetical protein M3O86_04735 [Actinomycetota bacterium]|nr:hypothetical protein [Actinomycetota bacterium]
MALSLIGAPAMAADQTVDGTLDTSVTMKTAPNPSVSWSLSPGANTKSGGTLEIASNAAYTVTLQAAKATMTKYANGSYGADGLATATTVTPTLSSGTAVPAPVLTGTTAQTLVTGVGLTTDTMSLELAQPVLISDKPANYRNVFTYTASAAL